MLVTEKVHIEVNDLDIIELLHVYNFRKRYSSELNDYILYKHIKSYLENHPEIETFNIYEFKKKIDRSVNSFIGVTETYKAIRKKNNNYSRMFIKTYSELNQFKIFCIDVMGDMIVTKFIEQALFLLYILSREET